MMKVIDAAAISFGIFVVTGFVVVTAVGLAATIVNDESQGGECFCWPLVLLATVAAAIVTVFSYRRLRARRRR